MSARKLGMLTYRGLQLTFLGLVTAQISLGWDYAAWWNLLPLALAYAVVTVGNRWGGAPDSPRVVPETLEVAPPVTGRWSALNSPADRTPSHGTHAHGQTYAIDVVAERTPGARPAFRWLWPIARRPQAFPAFGAPLLAVADGTVVRAADGHRDHLSRNSLLGLLYLMLLEGSVRELAGVHRILGNHVILDLGNGTYAAYAHLQRGSLTVREGDRVHAGQPLARCGNSGNSSEPHLHFQLMDGPDPDAARGVPFTWSGIGVPRDGETFEAPSTAVALG
ncbi:M23 family metallopeptidase [Streptomyces djakartensis]|uniref:Peptidase n=1 Tax=Streptomyces djakartensis TaxID=68193 RepID=A0ABQ2ZZ40_9ACTN|nr:M23 family metallopeptidase [Streptomyces djakartensis]GGY30344.1 peptidase [Streptomyces djakartensis]